jgi:hypothetical protein
MSQQHLHVSDEHLLLHADGEMSAGRGRVLAHLQCCSQCRERLDTLKTTLAEFGAAHREARDPELTSVDGARALLKARLKESAARHSEEGWFHVAWSSLGRNRIAAAGVAIAAGLLLAVWLRAPEGRWRTISASLSRSEEPDLRLTPGATVPVTRDEVCGQSAAAAAPMIPVSLKRRVFELYGVTPQQPEAYEVDYLITPELGGATDIRNLWPEPYADTVWNARVKDQLEDRLHRMVCRGDVDLATAQHDISTDWIAAYRKYFHADRPVAADSSFNFHAFRRSLPST